MFSPRTQQEFLLVDDEQELLGDHASSLEKFAIIGSSTAVPVRAPEKI